MSNLFDEFKRIQRVEMVDPSLLIPLMRWFSTKELNILPIQKINERFYYGNQKVFISELSLSIVSKGFMRYPKKVQDEYPKFFIDDVAKYYDVSSEDVLKSLSKDDLEGLKERIAVVFAYEDSERKQLGLKKRGKPKCSKKRKNLKTS